MLSGPALAVVLAAALTYYAAVPVIHGVKAVGHKIAHVAHKIVRPKS